MCDRANFETLSAAPQGAPDGRPAEHRRRGDQGQRDDQARGRTAASPRQRDLNFYGNVEGNDIFKGTTDIVVCDGFVGNVLLKTSEGLASMIDGFLSEEFTRNAFDQARGAGRLPVLQRTSRTRVDHRRYNGAALLGLRGLVFKSHGSADAFAFEQALERAL